MAEDITDKHECTELLEAQRDARWEIVRIADKWYIRLDCFFACDYHESAISYCPWCGAELRVDTDQQSKS